MELKVGMYVRTDDGIITKIIDNRDNVIIKTDDYTTHLRSKVIKASYNIIDLIEVGDYIDGVQVIAKLENKINGNIIVATGLPQEEKSIQELIDDDRTYKLYSKEDLLKAEIVTEEQFKSMSYKVGD